MYGDHETKDLMNSTFDLMIIDGAFPGKEIQLTFGLNRNLFEFAECALGLQYVFNIPFMYLNTVGFYTGSVSRSGSPTPYSITPSFAIAMTDNMNFIQRVINSLAHVTLSISHVVSKR